MRQSFRIFLASLVLLVLATVAAQATANGSIVCTGVSTNFQNVTCPDINEELTNANNRGIIRLSSVTGTTNITANAAPYALTSYEDGQHFTLMLPTTTTAGGNQLSINSIGFKPVLTQSGAALVTGDLVGNVVYTLVYMQSGDAFRVKGPVGAVGGSDDDIPEAGDFVNFSVGTGLDFNTTTGVLDLDFTELNALTLGDGTTSVVMTFNPTGTNNPVQTFGDGIVTWSGITAFELDNQAELRYYEGDGGGSNYIAVKAPATVTTNQTCTLQDDATPFDNCITAGGGGGDSISVNGSAAADANFIDGTKIAYTLNTAPTPDTIQPSIVADSINLPGDTTGNYIAGINEQANGIDISVSAAEAGNLSIAPDFTEIGTFTLGSASPAATGIIFDAGATDPAIEVASGSMTIDIGGTNETTLTASAFSPGVNDGNALGTTSLAWSDLFMATGAVINIANDWIATHSANTLTVASGDNIIMTSAGTAAGSVVTIDGTQTLTGKSIAATQITAGALNIGNNAATVGTVELANGTANTLSGAGGVLSIEGAALAFQSINLTAGTGLSGGGDLSAARSFALDLTEINSATWGAANGFTSLTFDATGTANPVVTMGDGSVTWTAITAYNIDDEAELRLFEEDGNGSNYIGFKAPANVGTNRQCVLVDGAAPIPDSCVGDGTDAGGGGLTVGGTQADSAVPVADDGSTTTWRVIPECSGAADTLNYSQTTNTFTCGSDAGAGGGMTALVDDTSPQLGGFLDWNGFTQRDDLLTDSLVLDLQENSLRMTNDAAGTTGVVMDFHHDSASPTDGDLPLDLRVFAGTDDEEVGRIAYELDDNATTTEDGRFNFHVDVAGVSAQQMVVGGGIIIGTSTTLPGAGNLRLTNIELGADTDTTISRSAAGEVQIEGVDIVEVNDSPTLGTITTTGNIELGNADTTLARSAAGTATLEGVGIIRGATGATDNSILRADGTGGTLLQSSALIIADTSGAISGAGAGFGIEFFGANGTDTTLDAPSAGNLQIEGNLIYRVGGTDVAVADGGTGASTLSDLITLATMTTGSYVEAINDGTGVDGSCSAEDCTYTPSLDLTEVNSATWGASNGFTTFTFDATGTTNPTLTFGDGTAILEAITSFRRADAANAGGEIRLLEDPGTGSNFISFIAPATIASDRTCTLVDGAAPIPDSCVGDGSDAGGSGAQISGTPANNQVAVWTDASTIEGDSAFTFDTSTDALSIGTSGVFTVGTIELGAASDTTLARSAAGEATLEGDAIKHSGKQMLWIGAAALKGNATSPASCGDTYDSGSNDVTMSVCAFDTGATEERADYTLTMPKAWNEGTLTFRPTSTCATCTASQTIQYELACVAISHDDPFNATMGTAVTSSVTVTAANDRLVGAESSAMTCAGTPAEGDQLVLRISRDTSVDNATGDALLVGFELFWTDNASTLAE